MIDKALLTGVFEKLGPDAVERGLAGHCLVRGNPFDHCFLGMAFGAPGALSKIMEAWPVPLLPETPMPMGLTQQEFDATWHAVDGEHEAFWALANEWLENRPASTPTPFRETVVVSR